jgi:hypothetical protein
MTWLIMGARYCIQALLVALFGKVVSTTADHVMKEAPDLVGVGKYSVHFKAEDSDGKTVEKTARFPFLWLARFWIRLQYKRHIHKKPFKTVYKTKHVVVTC